MDRKRRQGSLAAGGKDVRGDRAERGPTRRLGALLARGGPFLVSVIAHGVIFSVFLAGVMVARPASQGAETSLPDTFLAATCEVERANPLRPPGPCPEPLDLPDEPRPQPREAFPPGESKPHLREMPAAKPEEPALADTPPAPDAVSLPAEGTIFSGQRRADCVVYVVDRSGSMIDTFADVRYQMILSIARLRSSQRFHVILFGDDGTVENSPGGLVPATRQNKLAAARFLQEVVPAGRTNAVPALRRAFEVLDGAKGEKLIHFLTDGSLDGPGGVANRYRCKDGRVLNGNDAVLRLVAEANRAEQAQINTFLYGYYSPEADDVMEKLARANGGRYRFIRVQQ